MSNIHYAVVIIAALSLLLGLGLGQIYYQHQRIEQLEFNRFRQSGNLEHLHHCQNDFCRARHFQNSGNTIDRARAEAQVEQRLEEAVRKYNRELQRWENEWRSTERGLYRVTE